MLKGVLRELSLVSCDVCFSYSTSVVLQLKGCFVSLSSMFLHAIGVGMTLLSLFMKFVHSFSLCRIMKF